MIDQAISQASRTLFSSYSKLRLFMINQHGTNGGNFMLVCYPDPNTNSNSNPNPNPRQR